MSFLHKYKIPSRSEKGVFRTVYVSNDKIWCDCPALQNKECWHIRIYKKWKGEIKGNPEHCFYSHDNRYLEEHHLFRSALRQYSLSVYLTHWVHVIATYDKDFEEHLINLFFNKKDMEKISFKATIKEVSIKNLVSGDKGVRVALQSFEIAEAMKIAELDPKELITITTTRQEKPIKMFSSVGSVKKENLKEKDDRADIICDCAPAEVMNAVLFGALPVGEEVLVEFNPIQNHG